MNHASISDVSDGEEPIVVSVTASDAEERFKAGLKKCENPETVMQSDNPGLSLALQGLFSGPVMAHSIEELLLLDTMNSGRSDGEKIAVIKTFSTRNSANTDDDCVIVEQPAVGNDQIAPKKTPISYEKISGVENGVKRTYQMLSKEYLEQLWHSMKKCPPSRDTLRGAAELAEALESFMSDFQSCDFGTNEHSTLKERSVDVLLAAQKEGFATKSNNKTARAGLIRTCWANVVRAYGNNDEKRFGTYLHELMYVVSISED